MACPSPVLFVSHGAPTFALDPGLAGERLSQLGAALEKPDAVVIVSPHWMTRSSIAVTASAAPVTIHDFGGFPQALYELSYPAKGAPALAAQIVGLLRSQGWPAELNGQRGLDHGAWVPLLHLLPQADVPVVQVSMPAALDTESAFQFGQALQALTRQGVLVIGSGSLTHNLYEFRGAHGADAGYVKAFADWTAQALRERDLPRLLDYRQQAPDAARAHPSEEHLLPLFIALGAAGDDYAMTLLDGGIAHGVLAMDSYLFSPRNTSTSLTTGLVQ
ncbi:MAG: DODA-type extradiol aromatic ring-opening family dioxygenase [Pseudomonas sp.]|uniref:DODA-type extradiol aromatic ring-opening family dioxygenase n=1 Tax=Pseudomonas sp. TaxID=306 RepID=UPI003D12468B